MFGAVRQKSTLFVASLFLGLSTAPTSNSADVTGLEEVLSKVKGLQPKLSDKHAQKVASAVYLAHLDPACGLPWQILLSVAFNESSLNRQALGLRNPHTKDYGLMQINEVTARRNGFDRRKLMSDERYSVTAACKILKKNKEAYAFTHDYWLGIYRSGTALWKDSIRRNAIAYDRIIRNTAAALGYVGDTEMATR